MANKLAYTMKLKSGAADEYKRRHDEVWPEIIALLREHGFSDYSIFLNEQTSTLYAVYTASSMATASNDAMRSSEIMQKWWAYMADLVEFNEDGTPNTNPLKMVFHMD
jgi:L-rhamnose mutarotase